MYDIIIIGAGTAGIAAYKEAIKHTQNILIINDGPWDTTCARVGCMPSKVLISTANRMHDIEQADEVALKVTSQIDTRDVMPHVRKLRDRFTAATLKDVNSWKPEHKISGKAVFVSPDTVSVNDQHYQAKSFILAVGSTPALNTDWKNELKDRLISSDQVFELDQLPDSMAVIGSGVIAIELAQAMQRLGVKTTIFARSRKVGILTSPFLQELAQTELSKEMDIKFEVLPESVSLKDDTVEISYTENGIQQKIYTDYVLSATGRISNLSSLHLDHISESFTDLKQLPVDPFTKQLGSFPVFVIGDAHTAKPLQHEAAHDGRQIIRNCLNYPDVQKLPVLTGLGIVFSEPEMAIAGKSHKQLIQENISFVTGFVSYERQGRAIVLGKNKGAIEVYVEQKTRKLLGAELLIESAEHLAHLLSWMISENLSIDSILEKPFYHPTLEEGLRTALKHARRQLDA
ncbi:dihydrolipoyl dehydrogenase [Acinetobacter chinensis]|uniref:Dihydrolipoyl dehydrogenase n=1 Tax=Acinetobacter chinensis TaxID=2004650 RepID=A0ABU3WIK7_9GAMM|nr:dihydrolipoyl dehydrogenase [Acinetobacter chinensis]MDV2470254.1 dihydrolipoyl dehydrogenase [Acinetobacter chinensis]